MATDIAPMSTEIITKPSIDSIGGGPAIHLMGLLPPDIVRERPCSITKAQNIYNPLLNHLFSVHVSKEIDGNDYCLAFNMSTSFFRESRSCREMQLAQRCPLTHIMLEPTMDNQAIWFGLELENPYYYGMELKKSTGITVGDLLDKISDIQCTHSKLLKDDEPYLLEHDPTEDDSEKGWLFFRIRDPESVDKGEDLSEGDRAVNGADIELRHA